MFATDAVERSHVCIAKLCCKWIYLNLQESLTKKCMESAACGKTYKFPTMELKENMFMGNLFICTENMCTAIHLYSPTLIKQVVYQLVLLKQIYLKPKSFNLTKLSTQLSKYTADGNRTKNKVKSNVSLVNDKIIPLGDTHILYSRNCSLCIVNQCYGLNITWPKIFM